ncbi:MAG: DUF4143 domain-containing protein [Candidatus Methanoplasma sp.]|nr:DUF4143 domain-containing protein [Candidatus Methanoplasma sp.]
MEKLTDAALDSIKTSYRPRIVDDKISHLLSIFGGVVINGPKMCGKSWTGVKHSRSALFIGGEDSNRAADLHPDRALDGKNPRLIDEWQDVPKLWDLARRKIDFSSDKGLYIFTGSSAPPAGATSHTGTGRFVPIRMRTMSLYESGDSSGTVSISRMFGGGSAETSVSGLDYPRTVDLILRGGWPSGVGMSCEMAAAIPYGYIDSVAGMDFSRIDGKGRKAETMKRVIRSLARNTSADTRVSVIAADVSGDDGNVSEQTVRSYIDALKKIYFVEEQNAWNPGIRSKTRVRASPKRHLADPSLAAAAMGAERDMLLDDPNTTGFLFESMCYRDVCVYASAADGTVFHYKDDSNLEIDEIIELRDGRWGAVEVKMGVREFDKAAKNLNRLRDKITGSGGREPSFLMILSATGKIAHMRPDGVYEVPLDCLGP